MKKYLENDEDVEILETWKDLKEYLTFRAKHDEWVQPFINELAAIGIPNHVPAFLTIMQKWEKDFGIRIMKKRIDEDQTVYAFSYETTSVNINDALCDLQKILPEWEAVIIQEIAYEQSLNGMMRYVIGKAIIITYNTVDTLDLSMLALQRTRKILANANFDAMMNY